MAKSQMLFSQVSLGQGVTQSVVVRSLESPPRGHEFGPSNHIGRLTTAWSASSTGSDLSSGHLHSGAYTTHTYTHN